MAWVMIMTMGLVVLEVVMEAMVVMTMVLDILGQEVLEDMGIMIILDQGKYKSEIIISQ